MMVIIISVPGDAGDPHPYSFPSLFPSPPLANTIEAVREKHRTPAFQAKKASLISPPPRHGGMMMNSIPVIRIASAIPKALVCALPSHPCPNQHHEGDTSSFYSFMTSQHSTVITSLSLPPTFITSFGSFPPPPLLGKKKETLENDLTVQNPPSLFLFQRFHTTSLVRKEKAQSPTSVLNGAYPSPTERVEWKQFSKGESERAGVAKA